jgi:hypothetical protein
MIQELTINHDEHISDLPYEDVVASFMEVTGSVEEGYDSVASSAQTKEDFERIFKRREGSSGFMRFLTVDHGGWLSNFGKSPQSLDGRPREPADRDHHDQARHPSRTQCSCAHLHL